MYYDMFSRIRQCKTICFTNKNKLQHEHVHDARQIDNLSFWFCCGPPLVGDAFIADRRTLRMLFGHFGGLRFFEFRNFFFFGSI